MNKRQFQFIALFIAFCTSGCNDDSSSEEQTCPQTPCTEGFYCNASVNKCLPLQSHINDNCKSVQCPAESYCDNGTCFCGPNKKICTESQVCQNGTCQNKAPEEDPCKTVVCNQGSVCENGLCLCGDDKKICTESQVCQNGTCQNKAPEEDPCKTVVCNQDLVCNQSGNCVYPNCLNITCTLGKICNKDGLCKYIVPPTLRTTINGEPVTRESDQSTHTTLPVTLTLSNEAAADVIITPDMTNAETEASIPELELSNTITIPAGTLTQTIHVAGIADHVIDSDTPYTIRFSSTSSDEEFNGLITSVNLTNLNVDEAKFIITSDTATTSESGEQANFSVQLSSRPSATVAISFHVSDENEASLSVQTLSFEPDQWNIPQTFVVTGKDDIQVDGPQKYQIVFDKAVSQDSNYAGIQIDAIDMINTDDDIAGIIASGYSTLAHQEGESQDISVRLTTKPAGDVTVTASIENNTDEVEIAAGKTLTFTSDNYDKPQTLSLNYLPDNAIDGDQAWNLKLKASSSDTNYQDIEQTIEARTIDIDTADIILSDCSKSSIDEGASMTCKVSLSSKAQGNTTLKVTSSNTSLGAIASPASSAISYSSPVDVTITGVDDNKVDGQQSAKLTFELTSGDTNFNGRKITKTITVNDRDAAKLNLSATKTSVMENDTSWQTLTVKLSAIPETNVTLTAKASTGLVLEQTSRSIAPSGWNTGTTFRFKPFDNSKADGKHTPEITVSAESTDRNFNALSEKLTITVNDDDTPGIYTTVTGNKLFETTTSNGQLQISLTSQPQSTVTFWISLIDKNQYVFSGITKGVTLSKTSISFDSTNWSKPVTIDAYPPSSVFAVTDKPLSEQNNDYCSATKAYYQNIYLRAIVTSSSDPSYPKDKAFISSSLGSFKSFPTIQAEGSKFSKQAPYSICLPRGYYTVSVSGAGGGSVTDCRYTSNGGKGGYTEATYKLPQSSLVGILFGQPGGSKCAPGWPSGGKGSCATSPGHSGGGGGDTRLIISKSLQTDTIEATRSLIVAGGGGGGVCYNLQSSLSHGGEGGGDFGWFGELKGERHNTTEGGGTIGCTNASPKCAFGAGGNADGNSRGGGGGGWFGGLAGQAYNATGAGGSGFIFGKTSSSKSTLTSSDAIYISGSTTLGGGAQPAKPGNIKIVPLEQEID